jgi:hypothetical protein
VSDLVAKGFVLALALAATIVIGAFGLAGGEDDEPVAPGGRWRRFVERMKVLAEVYVRRGR